MLNWSDTNYKLTLGVGSLAIAGMLAERWQNVLSVWVILVIALLPFVVFVFVRPGELPDWSIRIAHVAASVWYVASVIGALVSLAMVQPLPRGWPVYLLFVAVGALPCAIVLCRAVCGRY